MGTATANTVLVVDFARAQLAAHVNPVAAAIEAGHARIRPVLMTALDTLRRHRRPDQRVGRLLRSAQTKSVSANEPRRTGDVPLQVPISGLVPGFVC
jgi:AcrB/AcrD/AcrF family